MNPQHHPRSTGSFLLLVDGSPVPLEVIARRPRRRDRVLVRLRSFRLDSQLASGLSPDEERLRAMRADVLVALSSRLLLAARWEAVARDAHRGSRFPDARPPLARRRILSAEEDIRRLIDGLRSALPVPARGVAMARMLLADGAGPVYNSRSRRSLEEALRDTLRYLDPTSGLMSPS